VAIESQLQKLTEDLGPRLMKALGRDAADIAAEQELIVNENAQLGKIKSEADRLGDIIYGGQKAYPIARLVASPQFREWAEANSLQLSLRITMEGKRLLREAVKAKHFELRDGRVVPCWLNWSKVVDVLKATGKDFKAFKKGIAAGIFKGKPDSDWYDAWMRVEQIPVQDDTPLEEKKMEAKDRTLVRVHTTRITERKYGESEVVDPEPPQEAKRVRVVANHLP
jgi:hypothetical protein